MMIYYYTHYGRGFCGFDDLGRPRRRHADPPSSALTASAPALTIKVRKGKKFEMEPAMTDVVDLTPAARVRGAYALWSESKGMRSDHWIELLADNIEMRSVLGSELPDDLAASRRTLSGALEYFQTIARDWEMIDFTVGHIVDGGNDVVMVGRCAWRNRATDRIVDTPKV